jgi:hypothetical protein
MTNKELILVLAARDRETLGAVRCLPSLRVAEAEGTLWLRGIDTDTTPDLRLRQLPAVQTYLLDEEDYLFPPGGFTPVGKLPALHWTPLAAFIRPELPTSALPGKGVGQYPVKLVPSGRAEAGSALVADLWVWQQYAATAPEVRLQGLRFAASEHDQVLVLGTPLPPVPGKEYWLTHNLLLPAGFDFELPLAAGLLAAKLNPRNDAVLRFGPDGSWEKIPKEALVPASRSAARLTRGKGKND